MGMFDKIFGGLGKTRESVSKSVGGLFKMFKRIDEDFFEELTDTLIMADIGVYSSDEIVKQLRAEVKKDGLTEQEDITGVLKKIIADIMDGDEDENKLKIGTVPSVITVIGVNGAGKTTSIGKLAANLKTDGKRVILVAADTFRAAAIDQLEVWAQRAEVEIIKNAEGADPASVVFDGCSAAKARKADVLICDTAGRLHNKKNLMAELEKISRVIDRELPGADRETLLVLDATTGQNAVNQAREFKNVADITGIILTKLDGTAKGGIVIAIKNELKLPVKLVGVGEKIDDLMPFDPKVFAEGLLNV